ncbi:MAG: hypothetical protein GY810_03640 [Aureispira sp.]|nr:hypothetical protein [Aureispira sp.]
MNKLYSIIIMLLGVGFANAQTLETLTNIPLDVEENSGMLLSSPNSIWLHNDSGDSAKLYQIDTLGNLLRTVLVTNAINVDWEDITQDQQGNVYIGDFGNNSNNRQNLKIYKITHPDSIVGNTTTAEVIHYTYPDQTGFPPPDAQKHFDMEAMFFLNDSLYLFSKNRTDPYDSYTKLYQIPADTGVYVATLLDSFDTQQAGGFGAIFSITAAAISPNGQRVALLNASTVWLFSNFKGHDFFNGQLQIFALGSISQKEALAFAANEVLYISDEKSVLGTCRLYRFDLQNVLTYTQKLENTATGINIYPNPTRSHLNVAFKVLKGTKISMALKTINGKMLKKWKGTHYHSGQHDVKLNFRDVETSTGWHILMLKVDGKKQVYRVLLN